MSLLNVDKLEQYLKWLRGAEACGLKHHSRSTLKICSNCEHVCCGACNFACPDCLPVTAYP